MPVTDPRDGKPGLSLETAASVVAREFIMDHFAKFGRTVRADRICARSVIAAYTDALAGACALAVQGRHGSQEELTEITILEFRKALKRDLAHLKVT